MMSVIREDEKSFQVFFSDDSNTLEWLSIKMRNYYKSSIIHPSYCHSVEFSFFLGVPQELDGLFHGKSHEIGWFDLGLPIEKDTSM